MVKKKSTFKLKTVRYFSEEFKRQKVNEIVTKKTTVKEVSFLYDIAVAVIYRWIHKYSPEHKNSVKIVVEMESESQKAMFYKERVAELERLVGQKQIEVEFLTKLIDLASEELDVDIKKNFSTLLLNGTASNSKKTSSP